MRSFRSPDLQSSAFNHSATATSWVADLLRGFSDRNLDMFTAARQSTRKRGAESRARTDDLLFTKQLLCQLSYPGMISLRHFRSCAAPIGAPGRIRTLVGPGRSRVPYSTRLRAQIVIRRWHAWQDSNLRPPR